MLRPTQGSREVTPSSDRETPSDITTHGTQEGGKGSKKRCKQCLQGTMTTTNDNNGEVGGSSMRRTPTAARNDKRQARPPMHHFKRLLVAVCPNHAYPVKHKLKDYDMMRNFMTSGSIT
jgi:hypothetical protein